MDRIGSFPVFVRASTDDNSIPSSTVKLNSLLELVVAAGGKLGLVPQRNVEKRTHFAIRSHGENCHHTGTDEDEGDAMLITRTAWSPSTWSMEHCLDPGFIQTWMWLHGVRGSCGMRLNFDSMFSSGDGGRGYRLGSHSAEEDYALSFSTTFQYFPFKDIAISSNARSLVPPVMLTLRDVRLPLVIEKMVARKLNERRRKSGGSAHVDFSSFRGDNYYANALHTGRGRGELSRGRGSRGGRGRRGRGRWEVEGKERYSDNHLRNNNSVFPMEDEELSYDEERMHHLRLEMLQQLVLGDEAEEEQNYHPSDLYNSNEGEVDHGQKASSEVVSSISSSAAISSGRTPLKGLQHFALSSILLGNHTILQGPQSSGKRVATYLGVNCNLLSLVNKEKHEATEEFSTELEEGEKLISTLTKENNTASSPSPRALFLFSSYSEILHYAHWTTDVFGSDAFEFLHINRDSGDVEPLQVNSNKTQLPPIPSSFSTNSVMRPDMTYSTSVAYTDIPAVQFAAPSSNGSPFLFMPIGEGSSDAISTDQVSSIPDVNQLIELVAPLDGTETMKKQNPSDLSRDEKDSNSGSNHKEKNNDSVARHHRRHSTDRDRRHRLSRSRSSDKEDGKASRHSHRHRRHGEDSRHRRDRRRSEDTRDRSYEEKDRHRHRHRHHDDRHHSHRHSHRNRSHSASVESQEKDDRGHCSRDHRDTRDDRESRRERRHKRRKDSSDEDDYYSYYRDSHKSSHGRRRSHRSYSNSEEEVDRKRRRRSKELHTEITKETIAHYKAVEHTNPTTDGIEKSTSLGDVTAEPFMDSLMTDRPDVATLLSTVLGHENSVSVGAPDNSTIGTSQMAMQPPAPTEPILPLYLTMKVPVLLLTYHGLRDALNGRHMDVDRDDDTQQVNTSAVSLPLERVHFLTLFDADRLLRPPLSDGLSPSHWVSVMNTVDVDCQLIVTSRNASALEDVQTLVTNTLLPDVAEERLWTWTLADDTIWCFLDTQVTSVEVQGTGAVESNDAEGAAPQYGRGKDRNDAPRRPRITGEDIDAAKLSHTAALVLNHFREYANSSDAIHASSGWQSPRVVVCCTTRREQSMIPEALTRIFREMSTSSDPSALLRVTTIPSTFGKGLAEVLVVCDTQIQDSAEQRVLREQCAVHFHCILHFSIPRPVLQQCGEDGWLLRSWLGSRARCLLGDTRHLYRQTVNAVKQKAGGNDDRSSMLISIDRIPVFVLLTDFQLRPRMADRIHEAIAPGSTSSSN